jgi:hypothetical protein
MHHGYPEPSCIDRNQVGLTAQLISTSMSSSQHFYPQFGYLHPSFEFRRTMLVLVVALACGLLGIMEGLLFTTMGWQMNPRPSAPFQSDSVSKEVANEFAAVQAPTTDLQAPQHVESVPLPRERAPTRQCAEGTWPYYDEDCLFGPSTVRQHHRRTADRRRKPWCAGVFHGRNAQRCTF